MRKFSICRYFVLLLHSFSGFVVTFLEVVRREIQAAPTMEKLRLELSFNKQSATKAIGEPRKSAATRNSAGGFVSSLRAFQPLELAA